MGKEGPVTGIYTGNRRFTGRCDFTQGGSGLGLQVVKDAQIYYVDTNKTGPASSGDGLSWDEAFLTITEGLAALSDYDILMIAPGNYNETATLEIADLTGVKIFGFSTGMQWGEGNTVIGDENSTNADLVEISGCQGLEIAGLSFYGSGGTPDGINFTAANYSTEIHHCCFIGNVGGSDVMVNAIDIAGPNGPDTYIHDCKFDRIKTDAIKALGQRNVISDNVFIVSNAGKGINLIQEGGAKCFNIIRDNYFIGHATDGYGIVDASATAGNCLIVHNYFANFNTTKQLAIAAAADANCINNYMHGTNGAITVANPSP